MTNYDSKSIEGSPVRRRRSGQPFLALILIVLGVLSAPMVHGQARARIWGIVADPDGKPIPGVKITVSETTDGRVVGEYETNKKGRYTVALVDSSRPFLYRFEKDGFRTLEEQIKIEILSNEKRDFTMTPGSGGATTLATGEVAPQAFRIYNDGAALFGEERYAEAKEKFLAALQIDPEMTLAHSAVARVFLWEEDFGAAVEHAQVALEGDPEDTSSLSVLVQALEALGETERAAKVEQRLAEIAEPSVAAFNLGASAYRSGDLETAQAKFEEALEHDPKLVPAHVSLARVLLERSDASAAAASAEAALALEPENPVALGIAYDAYKVLGQAERVAQLRQTISRVSPEILTRRLFERSREAFDGNRMDEAAALLKELLELDPDYARGHYLAGLVAVNADDSAAARQHLERFLALAPDDPDAATAKQMLSFLE